MSETFIDGRVTLHAGDSREVVRGLANNSIDSVVTDPPYALTNNSGSRSPLPGQYTPIGKPKEPRGGFMGKKWDTGETAFAVEFWQEILRVVKPGGHVVAFGGTRSYHRLACAIEDAGFEIRDQLAWCYGAGFPKSHDVSKGIDRESGAKRGIVGVAGKSGSARSCMAGDFTGGEYFATIPATDAARQWAGWGTALKPAWEPIVLARKPLSEPTIAANVLRWGTGALNIDGCRVGTEDMSGQWDRSWKENSGEFGTRYSQKGRERGKTVPFGRWPANLVHDGSEEVLAGFPEQTSGGTPASRTADKFRTTYGEFKGAPVESGIGSSEGSAARFFYQAKRDRRCPLCDVNIAENHSPIASTPSAVSALYDVAVSPVLGSVASEHQLNGHAQNAGRHSEQCLPQSSNIAPLNADEPAFSRIVQNVLSVADLCDSCATAIAQGLVAARLRQNVAEALSQAFITEHKKRILSHSLALYVEGRENTDIITTIPSLKILLGSVFHAIEESTRSDGVGSAENTSFAPTRLRYTSKADANDRLGAFHPTVKPVDLMQWLVRLITPPQGVILDPFAGTGTTGEAAFREGFRAILIEREAEYCTDIRRRMALCLSGPVERSHESTKARHGDKPQDHGPLFAEAAE